MTDQTLTVPVPDDPQELSLSIAHLSRLLLGWTDADSKRHKGVIERLEIIDEREAAREKTRLEHEAQRRIILVGLGLAFVGTALTQFANWFNAHLK